MIKLIWFVHQTDLLGSDTIVSQEQDYKDDTDVDRVINRALKFKKNPDVESVQIIFE